MSKQIPLATITMLVLSACCSTLSQGATPLETPSSSPVESASLDTHSAVASATSLSPASSVPAVASAVVAPPPAQPIAHKPTPAPAQVKPIHAKTVRVAPVRTKPPSTPLIPPKKSPPKRSVRSTPPSMVSETGITPYNRPYTINGESYTPLHDPASLRQRGDATWYNKNQQGLPTVNGEIYDAYGLTAAHPTLPIPSYARVTNLANRKSVVVRINDRGPFESTRKIIELSFAAANKLGMVGNNNRKVEIIGLESDAPGIVKPKANISFHLMRERQVSKPVVVAPKPIPTKPAVSTVAAGVYLQLGAFKTTQAAENFADKIRTQLGSITYPLTNTVQSKLHCIRVGPYPSPEAAQQAADEMSKQLGFKPLLKKVG